MIKNIIYIFIIYLSLLSIISKNEWVVEGSCDQAQPTVQMASQSKCNQYEVLYVTNPASYTSLTIDGYTASADVFNNRVVFNDLKAGQLYLNYSFFDSADKTIICNASMPITALPRYVNVVQQPKCPWNQVQVVPSGDDSTSFAINDEITYPRDQVVAIKPGTNFAIGLPSNCYYYFEVMPQTSTMPSIKIQPDTCGKTPNSKVTISNYADYTSLQLVGSNYTSVNGVFSGVAFGSYVLNATSTSCGIQLINVDVVPSTPSVNINYSPMPCNGEYQINATFSVAGYPNAIFFVDNLQLDVNSTVLVQDSFHTLRWYDADSQCQDTNPFIVPTSTAPITFTVSPPISTYSQPSVITVNYPGNYSDLTVNSGNYQLNGTQFITSSKDQQYDIKSSCYSRTTYLLVPVLQPNFNVKYGSCFTPGSITVDNYYYYSSISLTLLNGNVTLVSTNGSFPNISVEGTYTFNATEKVAPGVVAKSYITEVYVRVSGLNTGYITYKVEYVKLPLSCRSNDGTVKITPIYNDTITILTGNTSTVAYGVSQPSQITFSTQCPQILNWSPQDKTFNISYTIFNATISQKAAIAFNTNAPINYIFINGNNVYGGPTPYPIKAYGDTPFNINYLNYVSVVYKDGCQFLIYPVAYSDAPPVTPALDITPQRSDNCLVQTGKINVTNAGAFTSLTISGQNPASNGVWLTSSGTFTIVYKVGNTTGTMNVTVPITDGVDLTKSIINPSCSSWGSGRPGSDSYVHFKLTNTTSNTQLPVTAFAPINFLATTSYSTYYQSTQQLVGLIPGNYTGYVQSFFCSWFVNFTINPVIDANFSVTINKTLGSNDGIVIIGNPENRIMNGLNGKTQESNNYRQIVNLVNFNGTAYVAVRYNEICSRGIYPPIDFSYPVQPTYQLLPSGKCGTTLIQYDQATIDNYIILLNGKTIINSTTAVELRLSEIPVTYTNIHNFDVISTNINIVPTLSNNINYTIIPATCYSSQDGRVIINNPDPTVVYTAFDEIYEYDVAYNNVTHSFERLYGTSSLQITATRLNSQGLVVCDVAYVDSVQFDGEVPYYLVPTLQVTYSCDGKSNGNVVIGSINSTAVMQGIFIINGTTYTNSSIDLPVGYYQMTIPSMYYGVCTFNQGSNPVAMESAVMGNVGASPSPQVFNFQIKQASPISIKQLSSPKDNCGLVTIQGTGGSGNYTFELYYQSNNTMIGSQVSDVNGQVKFTIPSSASSLTFKVIAKDQSSCMTSTINIKGDCSVSSSSTLSISFFFILLSIISLLLI